jgi:protein-L-isoaspartate(D-aspartate) O-methyltransferase
MNFTEAREAMVAHQLVPRGIRNPRVLTAMRTVPRQEFVAKTFQTEAYADCPLPIGDGQTISQPYMVALMTELLDIPTDATVLEIGTGSGYQTAILAELARQVYTVERIATLSTRAADILTELRYPNVTFCVGDGTLGWPEHAPYAGIIVTAGAPAVPPQLLAQLQNHGKLVIPVGDHYSQVLQVITKHTDRVETTTSCHCVFVRLIGKDGWS